MKQSKKHEKLALPFLFYKAKRSLKILGARKSFKDFLAKGEALHPDILYNSFKKSPLYIVGINFKGEIDFLSDSVLENTGWKEKEVLLQKSEALFLFEEKESGNFLKKILEGKRVLKSHEIPLRVKNSNRLFCLWNSSVFPQEEYLVLMGVDITASKDLEDEKEMRKELEMAQERMIQLDQVKTEFVNTVSHELRTPLAILQASISNLKDGIAGPLTEKQMKAVDISSRSSSRLNRMIEDLLNISRFESGKLEIHRVHFSLPFLIHEIVEGFRRTINDGKTFVEEVPENIPEPCADKEMTARVLTNLLENAIRFAKKKVVVRAEAGGGKGDGKWIQVSVIDDGCGIPKHQQKELFNKFVQLHRPQGGEGYKGTGLGLAICKKIAEKNGGTIWVESQAGRGAAFRWTIPVG